jgi:peptidoglycan-associated lipoprotein
MRPLRMLVVLWIASIPLTSNVMFAKSKMWGYIRLHITPKQAYVFVDGVPIWPGNTKYWTIPTKWYYVSPGEHKLDFYNYGFKHATREVTLEGGQTKELNVNLTPIPGDATGPWGRIQIEGRFFDAVLLNGGTPGFFMGHVSEFNNENIWKQELLVPPGTYTVKLLRAGTGQNDYTGKVTVAANQRVVIYTLHHGKQVTHPWNRGEKLGSLPRFHAGLASSTVAVVKPTVKLTAANTQLSCGQSTHLHWTSTDAPLVKIAGLGKVPPSGEKTVHPDQATDYKLTAKGPGGEATSDVDVKVNNAVQSSLSVSPANVHFKKIGDKVVQEGSATLNWSSSNASNVTLNPIGAVGTSGSKTVHPLPKPGETGSVDQNITYTLTASNACGGTETKTATLHLIGSITPELTRMASMNSVFFPTDLPAADNPQGGLESSQQAVLTRLAANFIKFHDDHPNAKLMLGAHADRRGTLKYNQALSDRRAKRVEAFLEEQGVPPASIETHAYGKTDDLTPDQVNQLLKSNPHLTLEQLKTIKKDFRIVVLATNRRVDFDINTTGQQSKQFYPFAAQDSHILMSPENGERLQAAMHRVTEASSESNNP